MLFNLLYFSLHFTVNKNLEQQAQAIYRSGLLLWNFLTERIFRWLVRMGTIDDLEIRNHMWKNTSTKKSEYVVIKLHS